MEGACLVCSRNRKEASVTRVEKERSREGKEVRRIREEIFFQK